MIKTCKQCNEMFSPVCLNCQAVKFCCEGCKHEFLSDNLYRIATQFDISEQDVLQLTKILKNNNIVYDDIEEYLYWETNQGEEDFE